MNQTWKNTERKIAALLGGERVPITGRQRGSAPDIAHNWLALEVKHREYYPNWLHEAMDQAQQSKRGEQLPMVVLHQKGMPHLDNYCVLRLADFIEWFGDDSAGEN